jgi:hypothetical protein
LSYKLAVYTPSGEVVAAYEAYQNALGIKQVLALAPTLPPPQASSAAAKKEPLLAVTGSLVSIGSYDGVVRILSPLSWKLAFELPLIHPKDMQPGLTQLTISTADGAESSVHTILTTVEVIDSSSASSSAPTSKASSASSFVSRNLKNLPKVNPDPNATGAPKFGVTGLTSSVDCSFLAAREESHPRCLWIWDLRYVCVFGIASSYCFCTTAVVKFHPFVFNYLFLIIYIKDGKAFSAPC